MTDTELEVLLDNLESDRVERKESEKTVEKICQAICAFANDMPDYRLPGVIFVGVKDDGTSAGLMITDQLLLNLSAKRSDGNIVPLPAMTVQKRKIRGMDLAVIVVQPSDSPPVRFKGTTWIRVGPRRAVANLDEERRLSEKRRYRDLPEDIRPIASAPMEGLDGLLFLRKYLPNAVSAHMLDQNHRSLEDQLIATKFAHPGPPVCPTILGELTIGKDPTYWIPGAFVQFIWIDGHELSDPVQSSQELRSAIPDLLQEIDQLLKINIHASVDMTTSSREIRQADYPIVALQQIIRNAILHRSYGQTNAPVRIYWFKDRLEIFSPGGPHGHVNKYNFGQSGAYSYRNPNLATVLKDLGYVQQFGMGIHLTRKAMAENGNPPPEFLVEETHLAVILRKRP